MSIPQDWADLAGLDTDNVDAKKLGEFSRVPAGNYEAILSDYGPYEKDDKSYRAMTFTFTIESGPHAGETHRHSQMIAYNDPERAREQFGYVRGIFEDLGLPSTYRGPLTKEQIEGARCVIVLAESKPNKEGNTYINLRSVAQRGGATATPAASTAASGAPKINPFANADADL